MSTGTTPGILALRTIERNAVRLRERIQRGECPYPDAMQDANEAFIDRLQSKSAEDVPTTVKRVERAATFASVGSNVAGFVQYVGGGALLIYAFNCAPLLPAAVVAGSAAIGVSALALLRNGMRPGIEASRDFGKQMEAWSAAGDQPSPELVPWRGSMPLATLHNLTRSFENDVKNMPYGSAIAEEHKRLMSRVPDQADQTVGQLKTTLLARSKRLAAKAGNVARKVAAAAIPLGFTAGVVELALGNTVAGWGALAVGAVSFVASKVLQAGTDQRDARSLHYWELAMGAVPPVEAAPLAAEAVENAALVPAPGNPVVPPAPVEVHP